MLATLRTFSLLGIEALPVEVEVDVSPGALPKTVLVGLPEAAVKESTHRVERAMVNSGLSCGPHDRIVINLAPAELPKQAASFDLPITLGILAGSGQIASELFDRYAVVGELAHRRHDATDAQALSIAMAAAKEKGLRGLVVPFIQAPPKPPWWKELKSSPLSSLAQAVAFFTGEIEIDPTPPRLSRVVRGVFALRHRFRRRSRARNGQARDDDRRGRQAQIF